MGVADTVARLRSGPQISVGVLTADLAHLDDELHRLDGTGVGLVHTDVMDGVFCPMLTVGSPLVAAQKTELLKDVHLMVDDPLSKVDGFVAAGADIITFQVESAPNAHRVLRVLGQATNVNDPERGIVRGVALSPGTPLGVIEPLLDDLEYVLLLAIDPGWGGQRFAPPTLRRLAAVRAMLEGRPVLLGIDGGITKANVASIAAAKPDVIVTGSAIFDATADVERNARYMVEQAGAAGLAPA